MEAKVLRLPGQLYQTEANDIISNVYTYKILNKTNERYENVTFKIISPKGAEIELVSKDRVEVPEKGMAEGTLFIRINRYQLDEDKTTIKMELYSGDEKLESLETSFLGPRTFN